MCRSHRSPDVTVGKRLKRSRIAGPAPLPIGHNGDFSRDRRRWQTQAGFRWNSLPISVARNRKRRTCWKKRAFWPRFSTVGFDRRADAACLPSQSCKEYPVEIRRLQRWHMSPVDGSDRTSSRHTRAITRSSSVTSGTNQLPVSSLAPSSTARRIEPSTRSASAAVISVPMVV